jgi:hypothetical protein
MITVKYPGRGIPHSRVKEINVSGGNDYVKGYSI